MYLTRTLLLGLAVLSPSVLAATTTDALRKLPLSFEANQGQADSQVKFIARGQQSALFLTDREAVLAMSKTTLRFSFANRHGQIAGLDPQSATSSYFVGNDPARWQRDIPHFGRVEYRHIYPGIDLVFYGRNERLEYDFILAPGADPRAIRMDIGGAQGLTIDAAGNLLIAAGEVGAAGRAGAESETIRLEKPVAYQDGHPVPIAFRAKGTRVTFALGPYDHTRALTIDPVLAYSTFLGGGSDNGLGIATDSAGNIYLAGSTTSKSFPTANALESTIPGLQSAFIAKLNPSGTALVYATYLGGATQDEARSIAVDAQGNAYVTGVTHSKDFPLQNPLQAVSRSGWTAFVSKLSADGSHLVYSTFLGGSSIDEAWSIAVDSAGSAYVTGQTLSKDFPTVNAIQPNHGGGPVCVNFCDNDAFVSMLSADGSKLIYSTYLGGNNNDIGYSIAVDSAGNAYVAGETASPNFPLAAGNGTGRALQSTLLGRIDGFAARISAKGQALIYSTYLGGSADDSARAIAVDSAGNAYVTGGTASPDFPVANALQPTFGGGSNAFVSKLLPDGSAFGYSTYLGGSLPFATYINPGAIPDGGAGIAVDRYGNAYVTGAARSIDFPLVRPLSVAPPKGVLHSADGGATWLNPATSGGGTGFANALALGNSLQVDKQNPANLYLATQGGVFKSTDSGAHWNITPLRSVISALAIDPQVPSILYAGTPTGFYKSTDGALSWTLDVIPGNGAAVAVDPANPGTIYRGGTESLLRSTDRGATWSNIYGTLPPTQCGDSPSSCLSYSVTALAVDPVTSALYAGLQSSSIGPLPQFSLAYKRVGTTWTAVKSAIPSLVEAIAVDPKNPNIVYFGLLTGLYRSTDAGSTVQATPVAGPVYALVVDANSVVYAGVQNGVVKSTDGGATFAATGLSRTTSLAVALDPAAASALYVVADSGSDAFVAEINSTGSALVYSTTLGGGASDTGNAIALNSTADVFVTGNTSSSDFPLVSALQSTLPPAAQSYLAPQTSFASRISASCPGPEPLLRYTLPVGFYIAEFSNQAGTSEGDWGSSIQVAQGVMTGGFSFGGGLQEGGSAPAYGAFTVTDAQTISVDLRAEVLANGNPLAIDVVLTDASGRAVTAHSTGSGTLTYSAAVTPGFYVLQIRSGAGSPRGDIQATLHATAVVGGVNAGGFVAAGQTGYSAFYIPQAQSVSVQSFGASAGPWGAGCLSVRLLDSNRNVVAANP